jgi:hypothetical protein
MGDIAPSKMPSGKVKARRDDTDFTQFKEGGKVATKNWISGAIKHPGALHKELGVAEGKKIPAKKLAAAAKKSGVVGKRARLAETLKGLKKGK